MILKTKGIFALLITCALAGCGGGGQVSTGSPVKAAFTPGAYRTIFNCSVDSAGTLIDDNNNFYEICGTKLLVGALSGTIPYGFSVGTGTTKFTIFDSGTPASTDTIQLPSGPITIPIPAGKPSISTSPVYSGALFANKENYVVELNFSDTPGQAGATSFDSKWLGDNPPGSIMSSYSTLSGNYVARISGSYVLDQTDTLNISSSGAISGMSKLGAISGQILKFNPGTGVHDVTVSLTPLLGGTVTLNGVIGPINLSTQLDNFSGVLLAVSGSNIGFYKVFKHQ